MKYIEIENDLVKIRVPESSAKIYLNIEQIRELFKELGELLDQTWS